MNQINSDIRVKCSQFASIKQSYSNLLLCKNWVSLLAYSPLAMGIIFGKYFSPDGGPADAHLNLFEGRYSEGESSYNLSNTIVKKATKVSKLGYYVLADHISPPPLLFCYPLPFPSLAIPTPADLTC
ncbi:hypothetical protein LOK49_LG10G00561 [Camellia lanceoleosa]|uniref:Uncharacterized protein n=1 Tax=Camellia lanceoleosa TaxID=1840588 RepID=A0ACC0G7J9_9ERIC|nr:hypothetical protein LOK49_LG10G00561 [Camellia lanceoleosa]